MKLIEVDGVSVAYGSAPPVVRDVSFRLGEREALGIVGESGCGKSSLARALVGWVPPSAGRVLVRGRPWEEVPRRDPRRRDVQMIFQDPYGSLNPRLTALETVAEVFAVWTDHDRGEREQRAETLLDEVGLARKVMRRRPGSLSGGQCQRVGIARALAAEPSLLLADEPTSSLDVSVQAQILNLLLDLRESRGLALVLISHDLAVVRYMTDRTLVMHGGEVVEAGPTERLFAAPEHDYTKLLLASVPGAEASAAR